MKRLGRPSSAVAFHAAALLAFGAVAGWLAVEASGLGGRPRLLGYGVAVASGALAVLSATAAFSLLRARDAVALRVRAAPHTYLALLGAALALALFGTHVWQVRDRAALGSFTFVTAAWLLVVAFHLVPGLFLTARGFVDNLGRWTRYDQLGWFELKPLRGEPPRALLRAGKENDVVLVARLALADPASLQKELLKGGLRPLR